MTVYGIDIPGNSNPRGRHISYRKHRRSLLTSRFLYQRVQRCDNAENTEGVPTSTLSPLCLRRTSRTRRCRRHSSRTRLALSRRCGGAGGTTPSAVPCPNSSGNVPALDVHAANVPVLRRVALHDTQHTHVEIGRVGGGAGGDVVDDLCEGRRACGRPEADSVGAELFNVIVSCRGNTRFERGWTDVDFVCKVEPCVGGEWGTPLPCASHHPLQVSRSRANAIFELT